MNECNVHGGERLSLLKKFIAGSIGVFALYTIYEAILMVSLPLYTAAAIVVGFSGIAIYLTSEVK